MKKKYPCFLLQSCVWRGLVGALLSEILPWHLVAPPGSVHGVVGSVQGCLEKAHTPTCINTELSYIYRNVPKKRSLPPLPIPKPLSNPNTGLGWRQSLRAGGEAAAPAGRGLWLQPSPCCHLPGRALEPSWLDLVSHPSGTASLLLWAPAPLHEASGSRST